MPLPPLPPSNLFEDLAGLLSRTAFPGGGGGGKGVGALHLISLEGLLAVLAALAERCGPRTACCCCRVWRLLQPQLHCCVCMGSGRAQLTAQVL